MVAWVLKEPLLDECGVWSMVSWSMVAWMSVEYSSQSPSEFQTEPNIILSCLQNSRPN